jgi:hypothetical protein
MPKSSKTHKIYEAIADEEMAAGVPAKKAKAKAARIAQSKTGKSLATGKKPKKK